MKKTEFHVTNINRRGETFDPSGVTIRAGDIPGLESAIRDIFDRI